MRVARLEIDRFRGFESFVLIPRDNVLVVGEPRAGRSDLIAALRRVLDPRTIQARPSEWDVYRPAEAAADQDQDADEDAATTALTSVKVTLLGLTEAQEQDLDERLELLDPATGLAVDAEDPDAELGIRLAYYLRYDLDEEQLEHWLEYPKSGQRVPRAEREALKAVVLERNPPLQLRAEGQLRRLATEQDAEALTDTLREFANEISAATDGLAASAEIQAALSQILHAGPKQLLGLDTSDPMATVGFTAEDGSLAALLRTVQPTLKFDDETGDLPLSAHGSTTAAVFAAAEAAALAQSDDAIILADDFGDQLDAAAAEYLAFRLHRRSGQVWLTTRRAEVVAAFEATELLRLTRHTGSRLSFQLTEDADRKERLRRRHISTLLAPAMSAPTVALVEGPHDHETYLAVDRRRATELNKRPLSGRGIRLIRGSASGGEGGKSELPKLAQLAADLGFTVNVILDHDKPGTDDDLINELRELCDLVIRLPERVAIERAIVNGLSAEVLRPTLDVLNDEHELDLIVEDIDDDELPATCVKALKKKGGLHRQFVDLLPSGEVPPLANEVLKNLGRLAPFGEPLVTLTHV
jgi:putative ATP-dependent endonuclease of OLD family